MNNRVWLYVCIMLAGVFISSISQVMLKKASMKEYPSRIKEYLNPLVIGAYAIFVAATVCSIYAYKVVPLSWGPIIESSGYFFITLFGNLVFKEKIDTKKVISLLTIVVGILLFAVM